MTSLAVVTGAGGGLGRAIALRLGKDGFAIAAADVDRAAADETVAEVRDAGGKAIPYEIDVSDTDALDTMIETADRQQGRLTVLVNNAAVFPAGPISELTAEAYDHTLAVNQRAYVFAAQSATRIMTGHGGGSIVNIGSITQHGGWADMAAYVSTKGAVAAFTRALATEVGPANVRVNCVAPGAFPTRAEGMHEDRAAYSRRIIGAQALKRRGTNDELAAAVSFFAGPESSFVTGQTLNVDGGWMMA